ncbi:uncharacterized protein LOC124356357 [Homalodisca vitripennis]|uniref:uncharacterized protein LOC124356357 n=1 Tax=Homalodisca vitripennis TaxID=197043 RepID=UPI001EEACEAE|nr:uncharacterized protein LOC124356357 [Homalodisca vitripennis]KAG8285763.1 hypothetical protein J6590_073808 [Homalodisca vitripennis]
MNLTLSVVVATLSLLVFNEVSALQCNEGIINNVLKLASCPTNMLQKLHAISPATIATLDDSGTHRVFKCAEASFQAPQHNKGNASFTAYFRDESKAPLQTFYHLEEVGCGHMHQTHDGEHFNGYFLLVDKIACFYRCPIAPTEGIGSAGAAIPMNNQYDLGVKAQLLTCKLALAAAGFLDALIDVDTCAAPTVPRLNVLGIGL